jgi:D-sedoheptulose 7-phosphate isomerase
MDMAVSRASDVPERAAPETTLYNCCAHDMENWPEYLSTIERALRDVQATNRGGAPVDTGAAFREWVDLSHAVNERGNTIYFIGNGGSAGIASHMAADACKNGRMRAIAFNDVAMITATSNDLAYEEVFALPIARLARAGDLVVSISSSGNSPNIVKGLQQAREMGIHTITLSGWNADNKSRALGDLNFYIAAARYGWIESAHLLILHFWLDQYLNVHGDGAI